MQQRSDIEQKNSASGRRKGLLGTMLVHLALFGILILLGFSTPPPPDTEDGILVNFGTGETGMGDIEPSPPAFKEESSAPPVKEIVKPAASKAKSAAKSKEDPLLTQNSEEGPAVKKPDPEVVKKRLEKIEADKIAKEQLEAERIEKRKEEAEKKRIEADQKRESDIKNLTKNALANSQNRGTSSTSEGIAGGPGNQGDPNGSIDSKVRGAGSGLGTSGTGTGAGNKNISYELGGRGVQNLPSPNYVFQEDGKVVVEVSVDRSGKVVQATAGVKGSTTLNDNLIRAAKEAAMHATFQVKNDAPAIQKGTITYNFKLK